MVQLASILAAIALTATQLTVHAVDNVKTDWDAYVSPLKIPQVIDATGGGSFDLQIGRASHNWTADGSVSGDVYGYGLKSGTPTFPGPTIKVKRGVPICVTWWNQLSAPHLLADFVETSLTYDESKCYPKCGVPVVVHVHGLESPAKYDGLPSQSIYRNQSMEMVYLNNQSASTKLYHDHAMGLTRLNVWAGLAGLYIIEDKALDKKLGVDIETDIPLAIADRIITNKGELKYSDDNCRPPGTTLWVPESYGTVNTVNGVVMPYVEVPNTQVRFRLTNIANTRNYNLSIPFASKCMLIATDSGYVEKVLPVNSYVNIFPYERMELMCDFSSDASGTTYEVTDLPTVDQDTPYDARVLQVRVKSSLKTSSMTKRSIPDTLVKYKDLKALFKKLGGKQRTLTLGENKDSNDCPLQSVLKYHNQQINVTTPKATLKCTRGKVERWSFKNPTDDAHPFHWHLVNAQCGDTDDTVNTNALKDVVKIPPAGDRPSSTVTQVCYVACTPDEFLVQGSSRAAGGYNFDTNDPYLAHCHILEHEENAMMAIFQLTDTDDDTPNNGGSDAHQACDDH